MKTLMTDEIQFRKQLQRKAVKAANTQVRLSQIGKQIFRVIFLIAILTISLALCVHAQSGKHQRERQKFCTSARYQGKRFDYAYVRKAHAYPRHKTATGIFIRRAKRQVNLLLKDVFSSNSPKTKVP